LANDQKFHDIDVAFAALVLGYKRLRFMKAINQLALRKPRDAGAPFEVKSDGRTHSRPVTLKWQTAARPLGVY
jgi:hypothetical protein